ncbi:MAG: EAL domain-containing protein [Spirochaetia bacterium]|nr:EAL domain-containing protein [Spirochaetia bacterium]
MVESFEDSSKEEGRPWGETTDLERLALSRTLLAIMRDGVFFADADLRVRYANPAFRSMSVWDDERDAPGLDELYPGPFNARPLTNAKAALAAVGYWSGELARTDRNGDIRLDDVTIALTHNEGPRREGSARYAAVVRDVTAQREAEERLAWARNHDELTGLPNRVLFAALLESALLRAGASGSALAVVAADLDNFKRFNTDFSHDEGDRILRAAADRLCLRVHPGDVLARTGGDEFCVIMALRSAEDAHAAAEIVRDAFAEPVATDNGAYALRTSVGVAVWPRDGADAASLIAAAELAMQECKDQGKDGVMCFDEGLYRERKGRARLEASLREAIAAKTLSVHYQPVVRVSDGMIEGVEALVRWRHPERGDLLPDSFIPLAEETGLIVGLGELVLNTACGQGASWTGNTVPDFKVAVNVSPLQLERDDFPSVIMKSLDSAGLPPQRLVLEITESVLLGKTDTARRSLARLKGLGVGMSVDDFGTGYSNLVYVKDLPVDFLKIDRMFVRDMERSSVAREIVAGTITMAHRMNLRVVAEGVESAEQFYMLRSMECDSAQGYLFGAALPAMELEGRYLCRGGSRHSSFLLR